MQIATEFAELCKCENFSDVQAVNGYVNFYVNKEVFTKTVLNENEFKTNKSLKKALAVYRDSANKGRNQDV